MEIRFELNTEQVAKATVAILASYRLRRVSKGTKCHPQLVFTNAIGLIVIIAILYGPRLVPKAK
jgi:hypothetical protein